MIRPLPLALAVMIAPDRRLARPEALARLRPHRAYRHRLACSRCRSGSRRLRMAQRRRAAGLRRRPGSGRDAGDRGLVRAGGRRARHLPFRLRPLRLGANLARHFGVERSHRGLPGGHGFYVARGKPLELPEDRAFAGLDLPHGLSRRAGRRPAGRRQQLASDLRHAGRQSRRTLPARPRLRRCISSGPGGSAPTRTPTPTRTIRWGSASST